MFVITENIMRRLVRVFVGEMYGIHTYNIRVMGARIERGQDKKRGFVKQGTEIKWLRIAPNG
jgi:hypothetical protein